MVISIILPKHKLFDYILEGLTIFLKKQTTLN